jgi:hypothetical protein
VDVRLRISGLLALVALLSACGSLQFRQKDDSEERARQLEQVQLRVMRFADEYVGQLMGPLNALQIRARDANERLDALNWKVTQSTAAYINASHSNPVAGTMDMIVLAVLSRMVVEHDQRTGSSRLRSPELLETHEKLERSAWELGSSIMDEQQKGHLRNAILTWRAANPDVRAVALVHFTDVSQILASDERTFMSGGLLGFISIDATWGLDPAVREIAQTRQVVQQSMYYAQRAPSLLDMQVERLAYQLLSIPETRLVLGSVDRTGQAAERVGRLADAIPSMVAQEREAAIAQIVTQLDAQQARTRALVQDLHAMLDAGALASDSINTTVRSLDSLVARFKPFPARNPDAGANATAATKPTAIAQYAEGLRQLASSTQELQKLITTIDESSGGVSSVVHSATADAKSLAQYLSVLVILLAFSLATIIVAAVLALRMIPRRIRATHD